MKMHSRRARAKLAGILVLALLLSAAPLSVAAPGDLDPSFDGDGIATTDFAGGEDSGFAIKIDRLGRILVAGRGDDNCAIVRFNPDGTLDNGFEGDGRVTTSFAAIGFHCRQWLDLLIDSSDHIVAVGWASSDAGDDFALARYNPDGSLDTDFSDDGMVTLDFGGPFDYAHAATADSEGRIVVTGGSGFDIAVARYQPDGLLDPTFDGDGKLTTDIAGDNDYGDGIVVDSLGRIVVGGTAVSEGKQRFAVVRYNASGSLDPTFDSDGKLTTDFGSIATARDITLDSVGRIIVAGSARVTGDTHFAVARYNTDGSLDTSFDGDGKATIDLPGDESDGSALAVDASSRVIVVGTTGIAPSWDFGLVRLNSDGSPDNTFGGADGVVVTHSSMGDGGHDVELDGSGRIVLAGNSGTFPDLDFAVVRYLSDAVAPPDTPTPTATATATTTLTATPTATTTATATATATATGTVPAPQRRLWLPVIVR